MNRFRRRLQEEASLDRGQDALDVGGPLAVRPDRYNPEEGDIDSRAPEMFPSYNPELGDDQGVDPPAPEALPVRPDRYNPEAGDEDQVAALMTEGMFPQKPAIQTRRTPGPSPSPLTDVGDPRGNANSAMPQARPAPSVDDVIRADRPQKPQAADPRSLDELMVGPSPVVARALPVTAASQERAPAQVTKVDAGPKPTSELMSLLKRVPGTVANIYAASKAGDVGRGFQPILEGIQDRVEHGREMSAQDEQARVGYGRRKNYLEREARKEAKADSEKAEAKAEKKRLLDKTEQEKARRNKTFQAAFRQAYPGVAARLTEAQLAELTTDDAAAVGLMTKPVDEEAKATAANKLRQTQRTEKLEDLEKGEQIKKKYRKGAVSPYAEPVSPEQAAAQEKEINAAVTAQFGGEDKVPPAIKAQLNLARQIKNPKQRTSALKAVLDKSLSQSNKERDEGQQGARAKVQENQAYEKATAPALRLQDMTQGAEEAYGKPLTKYKKGSGENVPGVGPVENLIPQGVYGLGSYLPGEAGEYMRRGEQMKASLGGAFQERLREATGLASTNQEREQVKSWAGMLAGGSEDQVMFGLQQMDQFVKRKLADASRLYPNAAAQFNETAPNPAQEERPVLPASAGAGQAPAPAPAQTNPQDPGPRPGPEFVLVRNKKTGEQKWIRP